MELHVELWVAGSNPVSYPNHVMVGVAQSGSARVKVLPSNFIVSCCGLTK